MFSLMGNCVTWIKGKNERKSVTLLAVGLDNAGKTTTVLGVKGDNNIDVAPTIGFSSLDLRSGKFDVTIFDLGGGSRIRGIWHNYMAEGHGVIFVVDSSDVERMEECRNVFDDLISNERLRGKPVLILANKQDKPDAVDELDLCDRLNIDEVVNRNESYSKVVLCSALPLRGSKKSGRKPKLDRGIKIGFDWLLETISRDFEKLQERISKDVAEQKERNAEERRQKIERVKRIREERERQKNEVAEESGTSEPIDRLRPEGISHQELPNEATTEISSGSVGLPERTQISGLGESLLDDDTDDDVIDENRVSRPTGLPGTVVSSTDFADNSKDNFVYDNEDQQVSNPRALSASSLRDIVRDTPTPNQPALEPLNESPPVTPALKPKEIIDIQEHGDETGSIASDSSSKKKKKRRKKKNRINPGSDVEILSEHSHQTGPGRLSPIENVSDGSKNGRGVLPPLRNAPNFTADVEF